VSFLSWFLSWRSWRLGGSISIEDEDEDEDDPSASSPLLMCIPVAGRLHVPLGSQPGYISLRQQGLVVFD
jgi:hypothetical protein